MVRIIIKCAMPGLLGPQFTSLAAEGARKEMTPGHLHAPALTYGNEEVSWCRYPVLPLSLASAVSYLGMFYYIHYCIHVPNIFAFQLFCKNRFVESFICLPS